MIYDMLCWSLSFLWLSMISHCHCNCPGFSSSMFQCNFKSTPWLTEWLLMFRMKQPSTACLPTRAVTLMEEAWGSIRSRPVWLKVAWVPPGLSPLGTEPESQPEPEIWAGSRETPARWQMARIFYHSYQVCSQPFYFHLLFYFLWRVWGVRVKRKLICQAKRLLLFMKR